MVERKPWQPWAALCKCGSLLLFHLGQDRALCRGCGKGIEPDWGPLYPTATDEALTQCLVDFAAGWTAERQAVAAARAERLEAFAALAADADWICASPYNDGSPCGTCHPCRTGDALASLEQAGDLE